MVRFSFFTEPLYGVNTGFGSNADEIVEEDELEYVNL